MSKSIHVRQSYSKPKVGRSLRHGVGHFRYVLPGQSLCALLKKLNQTWSVRCAVCLQHVHAMYDVRSCSLVLGRPCSVRKPCMKQIDPTSDKNSAVWCWKMTCWLWCWDRHWSCQKVASRHVERSLALLLLYMDAELYYCYLSVSFAVKLTTVLLLQSMIVKLCSSIVVLCSVFSHGMCCWNL